MSRTSERRSSTDAAENVGTRSDPLIIVVMKCLPDSAKSQVIQAAASCSDKNSEQTIRFATLSINWYINSFGIRMRGDENITE